MTQGTEAPATDGGNPTSGKTGRFRCQLEASFSRPFIEGNRIDILNNGKDIFPAMLESIQAARKQIEFLTYVYWKGNIAVQFADALSQKAREGVQVRVLLDAIGAYAMDNRLLKQMRAAGVDARWFRPVRMKLWKNDNRTHRKILICDGRVGFTGGVGIADEWQGDARNPQEWRDTHFKIQGPTVPYLAGGFWSNWRETDTDTHIPTAAECPPPAGDLPVQVLTSTASANLSEAALLMRQIFASAQFRIQVCTPYLVLDEIFKKLLSERVGAGVEIDFMIPGDHIDSRFDQLAAERDFECLLDLGVRIHRYQKTMFHSKIVMVDSHFSSVGSCNLNQRSLYKDEEISVNVWSEEFQSRLRTQFAQDLESCERVTDARWRHRSPWARVKESLTAPFRQQL